MNIIVAMDNKLDMDVRKIGNYQTLPKIISELKDIRCCDGDAVTLECKVEATPPPDIRWEKEGKVKHYDSTPAVPW